MAHSHAAIKDIRKTKKRSLANVAVRKNIAFLKKQTLKSVIAKDEKKASELFIKLTKAVDKAAQRNVIPRNTANRRKSRLAVKIGALKKISA